MESWRIGDFDINSRRFHEGKRKGTFICANVIDYGGLGVRCVHDKLQFRNPWQKI